MTAPTPEPQPSEGDEPQTDPTGSASPAGGGAPDWKTHARSWEAKAKRSAKDLETLRAEMTTLRQSQMSDAERAIAQARTEGEAEGRKAALTLAGQRLVEANVRAILAGRREQGEVDALLEGIDATRFLASDGEPDLKALTAWADRVAPKGSGFPDLGQGRRPVGAPSDMNSLIRRAAGL